MHRKLGWYSFLSVVLCLNPGIATLFLSFTAKNELALFVIQESVYQYFQMKNNLFLSIVSCFNFGQLIIVRYNITPRTL